MFEVIYRPRAAKQLKKLKNPAAISEIQSATEKLRHWPDCKNVTALTDHVYPYRLRVGNYRILFTVQNDSVQVVYIEEVRKRDERTY